MKLISPLSLSPLSFEFCRRCLARIALLGLAAVLATAAAPVRADDQPAARRAFEIADFYRSVFVDGQDLSPDGTWVAATVRHHKLEEGKSWSELWKVPLDGTAPRQFTFGEHHDGSPALSPDGKTLYFVSDREEDEAQLWTMPTGGGEGKRLTEFSMGVSDPVVSPDGRWIAVTSEVYPECGADSECNRKIRDRWQEGPLKAHLADQLLYRHWTSWSDGRYPHILLVEAATGKVVRDLTPQPRESPSFSAAGPDGYAFSPDSKELCYVSNPDANSASSTNTDLWLVSLEDAAVPAKNFTAANRGWDAMPAYSPDGKSIAFLSMETPGYEAALTRIRVYERATGRIRTLTDQPNFGDRIHHLAWAPDSKSLYFDAEREGRNPLFQVHAASREVREIFRHSTLDAWQLTPDGQGVVYISRAIDSPTELYHRSLEDGPPRPLTRFNEALLREVDVRSPEELWLDGDQGKKVHVFLVKPHGFDPAKKYPLILNVHGGPQGMWADSYRGDWQVYPGKGYVLAFANPTGSTGYGQALTDRIACDWGGEVYRDLMKITDQLEALPYVDGERMGAMGWSFGGYMMMWFEGHTERFKALASMMGLYDLPSFYGATEELWFPDKDLCGQPWNSEQYRRWSPSESVANFKTPALVITGEKDYRVPYTQSLQFFTALQLQGVDSRLVVFPGAGHWPGWYEMAFYYLAHVDWFHRHLGGGEPPWDVEAFLRNAVFSKEGGEKSAEKPAPEK